MSQNTKLRKPTLQMVAKSALDVLQPWALSAISTIQGDRRWGRMPAL